MRVLLVDNKSAHLARLQELLQEKLGAVEFTLRDPRDMQDVEVEAADLVIMSGGVGRSIIKNPQTFKRMVELVVQYKKPTIGICLGAEAIAYYYGGTLVEMPVRRVGNVRSICTPVLARLIPTVAPSFMAYEFHKWKITDISEPLECLATSKDGVEVFKHTALPIWGMQFHPEVRRKDNSGHIVFENILKTFRFMK